MKKIRFRPQELYHKMSDPVRASLWFTVTSVIQKGIALLSTPIFTRLLTTDQYGVYSVYQSWYSIIAIFATLNLYAGVYNNGMTNWPDKRPQYTSALQGLSTTVTIVLFVGYIITENFWNSFLGLSSFFVCAIFIQALFEPAFSFWAAGQRYDYKYQKLVAISVLMGIASPVLGVVSVVLTEHKAEARVFSYVLVQAGVGLVFYIINFAKGKHFYIGKYWRYALAFNLPLIPHYLSQTVLNQADRIMISNMIGNSEAAIYSIAYTISMMFTIVTGAINNTFIPYTYKAIKNRSYNELKNNSCILVALVGVACIVAMMFGPEIIKIFAASEYYEARWVVPPVAEALLFMFIYPLFCNVEFYFEKTKFIMAASSFAAVINIGLNYIGIKLFGYIAAAYTTLVCYILLSAAHYIMYKSICKSKGLKTELYNIRFISGISVLSLVIMVLITLVYDMVIIRYAVIICIAIICFIKREQIVSSIKKIMK